ncbi:MAG: indole-3-glycerol phosphate synthase TrpC [Candidatus Omnitrophota bacterium]|nr:indole-3-glycerol phosphate synthase TrpC [Candidatus Omnitrophota bacterium]MBU1894352.1 indole-3-glycerol phosphate synthase TrpC [Candidatus Omnitrophota bacterium]
MMLSKIIEEKRREIDKAERKISLNDLKKKAESLYIRSTFKKNISRKGHINLIAEVKKSSPSKGIIRANFDPAKIALAYQAAGAGAISVLTDERFFDGKLEYLKMIKERVTVPVLRKDFIIDEYQIYESAVSGADAILLIAHILTQEELKRYLDITKSLGMETLVEVHNEEEVNKALAVAAPIIGINNRDLRTFNVDISITQRLVRLIPDTKTIVSESGISSYEEIMFLKSMGVNAVLIGETFMRAENIGEKVRELMRE